MCCNFPIKPGHCIFQLASQQPELSAHSSLAQRSLTKGLSYYCFLSTDVFPGLRSLASIFIALK